MPDERKPRAIGFNHVALEVGDIEEALAFYGRLFDFRLRSKSDSMAFIDLGDQFIALQKGRKQPPDEGRHFGLVVDDRRWHAKRCLTRALKLCRDRFSTSSTPGATASRSLDTTTFNSPKRRTYCGEWA